MRNWQKIAAFPLQIKPAWFLLSYLGLFCSYILSAAVWVNISNRFQSRLKFAEGCRVWFYSQPAKYLPGKGFIYLSRSILGKRHGLEYKNSLAGSAVELAVQLLSAFILVLGAVFFITGFRGFILGWRWIVVCVALGFIVIHPGIFTFIANRLLAIFKKERITLDITYAGMLGYLIAYMFINAIMGLSFYAFSRSLYPVHLHLAHFFAIAYIASFSIGILSFLTPAGIGVREGLLLVCLNTMLPQPAGLQIALLSRLWSVGWDVLSAGSIWLKERLTT